MINIHDAKTNLSKIIKQVETTKQPAIITRNGKPAVKIVALPSSHKQSLKGALNQKIHFAADYPSADKEIEKLFS